MISFFRINDPYRLIFILFILTILRLPVFLGDMPLMIPELGWMVAGEKLATGSLLYVDLWDDLAPFSALVYWIIHELFGRSVFPYHILSFLLVFIQAFIFNTVLINTKTFNETTFFPALVYVLLMSLFMDFNTLSPVLMSITFLLFALHNIFHHIDNNSWVGNLLNTGLYIGVASLFYMPCLLFIFPVIISYILFTGTVLRRYFLFLYGVFIPYLFVGMYFYWNNALDDFYSNYIYVNIFTPGRKFIGLTDFLAIATLPTVYLIFSFFKLFEATRYTSIQVRYQQIIFFMLITASVSWVFVNKRLPYQLIIFVPFAAFFLSHYFLLMQRKIFAESLFFILLIYISITSLGSVYQTIVPSYINYGSLLVQEGTYDELVKNKKILVLGDDLNYYKNASLATPYLNWNLAKFHFDNPFYYDNLTSIYTNFEKDLPEVIIDENGAFKNASSAIPSIQDLYIENDDSKIFILKKKSLKSSK